MSVIKELLLWLMFVLIIVGGLFVYYARTPIPLEHSPFVFTLKQGSSLKSAAHQIHQAGGLNNEWLFVMLGRGLGKAAQIKPGNYQLEHEVTPFKLLNMISKGQVEQSSLTIIEGNTFKQLRATLNADPSLRHDSSTLSEGEILSRIRASENMAEGLFFPDTYNYDKGSSDIMVLKRAYQLMQHNLQENWKKRDANLPFDTPYQALVLASIVEKETGQPGDRPMIASVFINRLRKNMRLQTDPTVIYGMGNKFDGNLRKKDLLRDTPYNTYTRDGLTPTPIALPGLASLQAVMHPAQSRALYFVASLLVVLGAFALLYVFIIGGQAFPLNIFPGYEVSSSFADGQITSYHPSIYEFLLGFGGLAIAFIITTVSVRVLNFMPQDKPYISD